MSSRRNELAWGSVIGIGVFISGLGWIASTALVYIPGSTCNQPGPNPCAGNTPAYVPFGLWLVGLTLIGLGWMMLKRIKKSRDFLDLTMFVGLILDGIFFLYFYALDPIFTTLIAVLIGMLVMYMALTNWSIVLGRTRVERV